MDLLNISPTDDQISKFVFTILKKDNFRIVYFLSNCQSKTGGFGGGPGQISHLAPTYAGTNALMICATKEAYDSIDR